MAPRPFFRRPLGNDHIAFWMISQRILPPVALVIPVYVLFQQIGLRDLLAALIITYVAVNLPIVVWLMRDSFQAIPLELEESAMIDSASRFTIFRKVVLPISRPSLASAFLCPTAPGPSFSAAGPPRLSPDARPRADAAVGGMRAPSAGAPGLHPT